MLRTFRPRVSLFVNLNFLCFPFRCLPRNSMRVFKSSRKSIWRSLVDRRPSRRIHLANNSIDDFAISFFFFVRCRTQAEKEKSVCASINPAAEKCRVTFQRTRDCSAENLENLCDVLWTFARCREYRRFSRTISIADTRQPEIPAICDPASIPILSLSFYLSIFLSVSLFPLPNGFTLHSRRCCCSTILPRVFSSSLPSNLSLSRSFISSALP